MRMLRRLLGAAAALAAVTAPLAGVPSQAAAADEGTGFSHAAGVGVHNAYEKAKYPYFADALDSGASLLELDLWTWGKKWIVRHDLGFTNDSNCVNAPTADRLRTNARDQDFAGC